MHRKLAHKIAVKFAKDLEGPLGRIPFERVVEKHIAFFDELRSEGASWPQIADLLAGAGVTRKDGKPMSASQIRATLSRISSNDNRGTVTQKKPIKSPSQSKGLPPEQKGGQSSLRKKMQQAAKARRS